MEEEFCDLHCSGAGIIPPYEQDFYLHPPPKTTHTITVRKQRQGESDSRSFSIKADKFSAEDIIGIIKELDNLDPWERNRIIFHVPQIPRTTHRVIVMPRNRNHTSRSLGIFVPGQDSMMIADVIHKYLCGGRPLERKNK